MNDIEMKPEVALEILEDKIGKIRDIWFRDALVLAIEALKEANKHEHDDSIFTR